MRFVTAFNALRVWRDTVAGIQHPEGHVRDLWDREDLIAELQRLLDRKNQLTLNGGPYDRYILVIHTNELVLDWDNVGRFLQGATFHANFITNAFLGLSYHGGYPVFPLQIKRVDTAARQT